MGKPEPMDGVRVIYNYMYVQVVVYFEDRVCMWAFYVFVVNINKIMKIAFVSVNTSRST